MSDMILKTPSSFLRPWSMDDRLSLVRHADNPDIAASMRDGFPSPYTLADADRFLAMATGDHPHLFMAVVIDDQAVGGIGIHLLDDIYRRSAEIGYWLSRPYWGQGIISDAVSAVLPVAFRNPDIIRIQAGVFSNNPRSMRVLEKNGFVLEAIHKKAIVKQGKILDEHLYVFFRDDESPEG
ncbi:MAG TPA: GNAT family protein [Methanospirillum sp.]|uniref:GNAT family N-acetyltransferase n=1 Tax=Methanospirillum sp. TaxID=45200 RepID=UPI002CF9A4EF|nr:GNAT family protein [Methanospirillum sp.]HWQ63411.1 GNAT family protein [Methanospirillum sp.]